MKNPVVSGLVYLFEMLISYLFFSNVSERKKTPVQSFLIGAICFCLCFAVNLLFENNTYLNGLAFLISNLIFALACFQMTWKQSMFYSFCLNVLCAATEFIIIAVMAALTQAGMNSHKEHFSIFLLVLMASKMLYFGTSFTISKLVRKDSNAYKVPTSFVFFPLVAICCLLVLWYCGESGNLDDTTIWLLSIAGMLLFSVTIIMFVTFQHQREKEYEYIQMKHDNARLSIEKSYYEILENQNRQLMMYAHDTKNHLAAMQSLNSDPRIESYISKLSQQLADYSRNCHSGNKLLDVMINKYSFECERKGIHFEYDVKLCNLDNIDDIDLVAVLGNLMDNAVSAAEQSQLRKISLITAKRNSYSIIIISNSYDAPPSVIAGNLATTKVDREHHGYGLKSVRKTLKRYDGDFEWNYDETSHTFTVTVMIGQSTHTEKTTLC